MADPGRALVVGACAGLLIAGLAALLANAFRCIDSPAFYDPGALVWAALGAGALAAGAVFIGSRHSRPGAALAVMGVTLLAYAIVGPPYKACA
ncbi:MAG: hypothetical protein E6J19_05285 [Chloroflexi bacterium]|nr:MAG: hypothetical protein E6J27_05745 [Chloroflexota bacterium]TMC57719.1 MAG: hypothetical protein E6J19_05285 [Chloroflexota bacterium]